MPPGRPRGSDVRLLVTGSQGTVGRALAEDLRVRGYSVLGVDLMHGPDQATFALGGDAEEPSYARCDIGSFRQIERIVDKLGPFDVVYNCAAEFGRWNGEDHYEQVWQTNAIGTKNIIRLQERDRFRLVHFSSSEVYGDYEGVMAESVMDECEVRQLNDYALSKWVNEQQISNSITQFGTETVIVRLFNTYGPGEYYSPYRSVNCRFLYCALHGLPWTVFGGHERTSTYLADTVRTLGNIVDSFRPAEIYNIGGTALHSIEELSDVVLEVSGASPGLVRHAESEILTTKRKVVDTSKAVRDLDHQPVTPLLDGMRMTADWMRAAYGL